MSLTTYLERIAALGIGRGKLASGFPQEWASVLSVRERVLLNSKAPMKALPPPLIEDLSRFQKVPNWRGRRPRVQTTKP